MSRRPAIVIADLDPNVTELTDEQLELVVGGKDKQDPDGGTLAPAPPPSAILCSASNNDGTCEDVWRE